MENRSEVFDGEHAVSAAPTQVCPWTQRNRFRICIFPLAGIVSLIWFLIRVLPKPSRAAYPCQRVAGPVAASFVVWASGVLATALAYRRWKTALANRRRLASVLCAAAALAAGAVTVTDMPRSASAGWPAFHDPIGVPKGIHPGRVVWVWNPGATDWAGYSSSDRWYEDAHTDPAIVERMVSQAVRAVAGKNTDQEAWDAIFRCFNQTRNGQNRGYAAGEKIMIKLNLVDCNIAVNNVSLSTWDKLNTNAVRNKIAVAPQMVRALLKQLVYTVGVNQSDIIVGDPTAYWPNCYLTQIRAEYPNVIFVQHPYGYTSAPYRTKAAFSSSPFNWSSSGANGKQQDYLPTCYVQAAYLINFTTLKGHSGGVTLCGKNDYGSLIRLPNGKMDPGSSETFFNLHYSLPNPPWSPGTARYRAIVDLMGHAGMGGKTLLYMIDGLYGGYYADSVPYKWNMAPFNGDWPSSLFVSQDPVAIDSVGYDFLNTEWPSIVANGVYAPPDALQGGAEDYLHEAALADNPPSGTFYDPDKDGVRMTSLGVHEHWNNSTEKKYSRNRGLNSGIELVSLTYDRGSIQRAKAAGNASSVLVAGAIVSAAFTDYFYVESDDRAFGIRVNKTSHGLTAGQRVNVSGSIYTNSDHERYISASKTTPAGTGTIAPVFLTCRDLGGGDWNFNAYTGSGQKGIAGACGLNNIGLLVRVSGKIVERDTGSPVSWFRIDDGSGVSVKCVVPSTVTVSPSWLWVGVTGVSSCEKVDGEVRRVVRVRRQSDIAAY